MLKRLSLSFSLAILTLLSGAAYPAAPLGQAAIDLAGLAPRESLAAANLSSLAKGSMLTLRTPAGMTHDYVVDSRHATGNTVEIRGHLSQAGHAHLVLGINPNGMTGFFETPDGQVYALGYADGVQVAGQAGDDWLSDRLAPVALSARSPGERETPVVAGAMAVAVDLPHLSSLARGDTTSMQFPGLGAVRVVMDRSEIQSDSVTWVGHLADFGDNYPVLITYSGESVEGSALTPRGEIVLTRGYAYNPQALGLKHGAEDGENCALGMAAGVADGAAQSTAGATGASAAGGGTAGPNTVDVLVYYSPGMETVYGSAAAVATRVDAVLAAANQAYVAGGLGYTLRRVGLKKVATSDTDSNGNALTRLTQKTGEFASAQADRDAAGADVVTLIRPFHYATQQSCGVGYVGGYAGNDISLYSGYMFSVVSEGSDRNGTNYYCDTLTLAHEIGHNLGLMHDRATVASQGGGVGVKPYAYGYAVSGKWGTIMSYTFPHQYRFSDPDDATCHDGTQVCGVPSTAANSADNALALTYTLPVVAGFKTSAAPGATITHTVSGIVSLDGKAVAGARITPSLGTVTCSTSGSTGLYSCQAPAGATFTLTPSISLTTGASVAWTPASQTFNAIAANATANFSGKSTVTTHTITGKITLDGKALSGATVKVTGSGASCGASNSSGVFTCAVTAGSSFTLSPSVTPKAGSTINWTPASVTYTNVRANAATANLSGKTGYLARTVSGTVRVTAGGVTKALGGVGFTASITGVSCGKSDSAGRYSCTTTQPAAFTLKPSYAKSGYRFTWPTASVPASGSVTMNITGSATCPRSGCKL